MWGLFKVIETLRTASSMTEGNEVIGKALVCHELEPCDY